MAMESIYNSYSKNPTVRKYAPKIMKNLNYGADWALQETNNIMLGLYNNTTLGKSIIDTLVRYCIGKGLSLEYSPDVAIWGVSQEEINDISKKVEILWKRSCRKEYCDYYGKSSFGDLQRQAFRQIVMTGDVLQNRIFKKEKGEYLLKIQNIPGRYISNKEGEIDNKNLVAGVKINEKGIEEGYFVENFDYNLIEKGERRFIKRFNSNNVEVASLIHLCDIDSKQRRGISFLNSAKPKLIQMSRFDEAYLQKAIAQAILAIAIEKEKDEYGRDAGSGIMDNLISASQKSSQEYDPTRADYPVAPGTEKSSSFIDTAGAMVSGNPGEKLKVLESSTPGANYKEYKDSGVEDVTSACHTNREQVVNSYSSNYSASRATIVGAEREYGPIRQEFADKYCRPLFEIRFDMWVKQGFINPTGYDNPIIRDAWLNTTWAGPPIANIDPTKMIDAGIKEINAKVTTREKYCRDVYGTDFDEVVTKLALEEEKIAKLFGKNEQTIATDNNTEKNSNEKKEGEENEEE